MSSKAIAAAAVAAAIGIAGPASAEIVIVDASSIQGSNILFNSGDQSGNQVTGITNDAASAPVLFTGAAGAILNALGGQARVQGALNTATPNPNDVLPLKSLTLAMGNGGTFNDLEFNLFGGKGTTATFTLTDNAGTQFTFDRALSNGSNFFGFQGINGQTIREVTIAVSGVGFRDLRQVRLVPGAAVPEPASWALMIGGLGLVGMMGRRRVKPRTTYS